MLSTGNLKKLSISFIFLFGFYLLPSPAEATWIKHLDNPSDGTRFLSDVSSEMYFGYTVSAGVWQLYTNTSTILETQQDAIDGAYEWDPSPLPEWDPDNGSDEGLDWDVECNWSQFSEACPAVVAMVSNPGITFGIAFGLFFLSMTISKNAFTRK